MHNLLDSRSRDFSLGQTNKHYNSVHYEERTSAVEEAQESPLLWIYDKYFGWEISKRLLVHGEDGWWVYEQICFNGGSEKAYTALTLGRGGERQHHYWNVTQQEKEKKRERDWSPFEESEEEWRGRWGSQTHRERRRGREEHTTTLVNGLPFVCFPLKCWAARKIQYHSNTSVCVCACTRCMLAVPVNNCLLWLFWSSWRMFYTSEYNWTVSSQADREH